MFEYELETQLIMLSEFVQYILIIEMIITSVSCIDLSAPTNEIVSVTLFLIQLMFGGLLSDNVLNLLRWLLLMTFFQTKTKLC